MIWSGVYETFSAVPAQGNGFVHQRWVEKSIARLEVATRSLDPRPSAEYPIADAIIGAWNGTDVVRVLDVGGNLGQLALDTQRRLPGVSMEWTVIERADLLTVVSERVTLPSDVTFHTSYEELQGKRFDVLHLGSVVQYFDEWEDELTRICTNYLKEYAWMAISDAMASAEIETFVTRQSYYESGLPMRFLSINELLNHLKALGFSLVLLEPYVTSSTASYYPEVELPPERQISYPHNMILRR